MSIKGSITSYIDKCTNVQNDLIQFYETIQKIGDNKELCLIASLKCEQKIQQALTVLGKSGKVFTIEGKSEHDVRIARDSESCGMGGCCVLPNGQVLVADFHNKKVKLLNQKYQVVNHWDVSDYPRGICQITPSEVAVTVNYEVQFITVAQSQLVLGRKLVLQHECKGIAHHQGNLFISSGTALFKYLLNGKLVCRLYKDASYDDTVYGLAVSPTGDRLYITHPKEHTLLTLARNGTVLATYTDPHLRWPRGVHVTPAGQVLVCGYASYNILQVDSEGRRKLATLLTGERDGVYRAWSICYSSSTSSIIVGQWAMGNMLVFRVK